MNINDAKELVDTMEWIAKAAVEDYEYRHSEYAGQAMKKARQNSLAALLTCCGFKPNDITTQENGGTWGEIVLECRVCKKEHRI